jgi:hypothetical protein
MWRFCGALFGLARLRESAHVVLPLDDAMNRFAQQVILHVLQLFFDSWEPRIG